MKYLLLISIILFSSVLFAQNGSDESWKVYDDNSIAEIRITVDPSDLEFIYQNPDSDSLHVCTLSFKNSSINEIVDSVGIRIRGNTSRNAQKKSFKISFNTFKKGREFYGLDKLNLNGEHNDPSVIRSKLSWEIYRQAGITATRAAHAAVYINDEYYGLYISVEHIDDEFIKKNFEDDSGNLWKCLYPANLEYIDENPDSYKFNSGSRRTYDLITNEDVDDYLPLKRLISVTHNFQGEEFADSIESFFSVPDFLKYLAVNILTGSWDDYRFLKNNYYLYYSYKEKMFHWIPYDYDNTFGVDWFNQDWANINPYDYPNIDNTPRPLSARILGIAQYRNLFTHYLDFYNTNIANTENLNPFIERIKQMAIPYILNDHYYTLDYGFNTNDFFNSYTDGEYSNQHVKKGLKQFINERNSSLESQTNYYTSIPIVYSINFNKGLNDTDSLVISAAVFSKSNLTDVRVLYQPGNLTVQEEYQMQYSPVPNSKIVEEADRWIVKLPPLGEDGFGYFRIKASNQSGLFKTYPRVNSIKVGNNSILSGKIFVNEFLAINDSLNQDENGNYGDWVELYNSSNDEVDLENYYLTDSKKTLDKWKFPSGSIIQPNGFLLIWCDKSSVSANSHSNFKLNGDGEFLALTDRDRKSIIDSISFQKQKSNISYGRTTDGAQTWNFMEPTPLAPNLISDLRESISEFNYKISAYPNPLSAVQGSRTVIINYSIGGKLNKYQSNGIQSLNYSSAPAKISIKVYDILGREVKTLVNKIQSPGNYEVDFDVSKLTSGVYIFTLNANGFSLSNKLMLIK